MNVRRILVAAVALTAAACSSSSSSTPTQPAAPTCTSFTYSTWGACASGTQTRTVVTSSPSGCTGGAPVTSQPCTLSTSMRFTGTVLHDTGGMAQPSALSGASIRASVDRNADGVIAEGEYVTTTSASDGSYVLEIPVSQGDLVVVRFARTGSASVFRTVQSAPGGSTLASATLKDLETLSCTDPDLGTTTSCTAASGLVVKGLPAGTSGSARVFNPVTDTASFPGDFKDSTGALLQSGVFASFSLKDGNGDPLEQLSTTATVKMKIPQDTWDVVRDITPGTGRIDVPFYAFDEAKGTWVRDGTGYLEDENGLIVPESAGTSIRTRTYSGTIYAVGQVSHFSSWNCDWPVDSHGRVGGEVGECWWNGERKPCAGATVSVSGATYTGTSTPFSVGADGRFAVDVMRSEGPGEDVDRDGVPGETTRVRVRVTWNGSVYDLGTFPMPTTATTGGAVTNDLGALVLNDTNRLQAAVCTVTGTLRNVRGDAMPETFVMGWDESIPPELVGSLCYTPTSRPPCTLAATSDPSGVFTISTPQMGGLTLFSYGFRNPGGDPRITEVSSGSRTLSACPSAPVTLTLDQGSVAIDPTLIVSGAALSWTPSTYGTTDLGANAVGVQAATGGFKWMVTSDAPMTTITYGTVPAGAQQVMPSGSSPEPLAPGDVVWMTLGGTTADGFMYWGSASTTMH